MKTLILEKFIRFLLKISALLFVSIAGSMLMYSALATIISLTMRCGESEFSCFGRGFILQVVSPLISLAFGIGAAIWLYRRFMVRGQGKRKTEAL